MIIGCLTEDCTFERASSEQGIHCAIILLSTEILLHERLPPSDCVCTNMPCDGSHFNAFCTQVCACELQDGFELSLTLELDTKQK